jgi:hypothetical protein
MLVQADVAGGKVRLMGDELGETGSSSRSGV